MKKQISAYIFCIAVGFLLALTIINPKKETKILKGETTVITKVDTVEVPKPYPVTKVKEVFVKVPYKISMLDTVYMVNESNYYRDTVEVENKLFLTYNAKTTGTLDSLTLGYIDNRPDKIITKTETIVKQPGGLYIGVQSNLNLKTSAGAMYIKDRNIIGVSVNLNQDSFSNPTKYNVSYYRRLF